jgi:hypothetical protein
MLFIRNEWQQITMQTLLIDAGTKQNLLVCIGSLDKISLSMLKP